VKYPEVERMPLKELKAFKRVHVLKDGTAIADFKIPVSELQKWDLKENKWKLYNGDYTIVTGSSSADEKLTTNFKIGK
jgi:beta-glucosidase